ncbi:MAG TPA: nucleoside-diphosphate sugar epimerase/dehydratase [Desulfobacterales bacterium]|nr:nucleoside-diphosphate sugar epimerase/dehydratase [Desulfobacterales bacterium]
MNFKIIYKNFFIVLGIDLLLLTASLFLAYLIRFDFDLPQQHSVLLYKMLPFVLIFKIISFYFFDLYRGMWRYTSIADLLNIIKASFVSTLCIVCLILFSHTRFIGFPRSVFIMDWCFTILFISGYRLGIRVYFEHFSEDKTGLIPIWKTFNRKHVDSKRLLIIGAGNCGEKIYREIRDNAQLHYNVLGFLDDDPAKVGKKIHGIPVLSYIRDISKIIKKTRADEALIAIPSTNSQQMRDIVEKCKESKIKFKTIPGMGELINGKVTINAIREVAYRDLLGREVIKLDEEQIGAYLQGQRVMVTGAGGSIGSELCRQICRFRPKSVILYERAESPLYEIELELKQNFDDVNVVILLADVQDKKQLEKAFETYKPQTVFHAAAYKHVPMLELQPWRAISNNIQGTLNMLEIANKFNVERFVFVSTDKAVRPANVMGASKRVAEMLVQSQNGCGLSKTRFMIVRFGNVVGSVGSVVPLFKKQIEKGGPVTVTHPEVTRFFMTIPEACQLILQAGAMGSGGEIFLLDMGTSIKIDDMARDLIRFSGFEPDVDIAIEYIGLRPGEKLYEELIIEGEDVVPTSHEKIMVLRGVECNLQLLNGKIDELAKMAEDQEAEKIKAKLQEIVPEYRSDQTRVV